MMQIARHAQLQRDAGAGAKAANNLPIGCLNSAGQTRQ